MPGAVEVIEWGITMLELMTCLGTKRWDSSNKLQPHKPMMEVRAKHHTFYFNHREAERCATTYIYKRGATPEENEPGLERDPEDDMFGGEHERTRVRFLYTAGIEGAAGNEPPPPEKLQKCCSMVR